MVKRQAGVPGFNTYMYMYLHMQCRIARLFLLVVHGGLFMSSLAGRTLSMIPPQGRDYFYYRKQRMLSLSRHLGAFHLHPWATHKGWLRLTGLLIFQFLQDCYKNALHCGGGQYFHFW